MTPRKLATAAFAAALVLGGAACGDDEDGDGATTDEEVGEVQDGAEDVGDELSEEAEQGASEAEE